MSAPATSSPLCQIGLANSGYIATFLDRNEDQIDYVEIAYEQLQHEPQLIQLSERKPMVLHCASLSLAGTSVCQESTFERVKSWVERTSTPWLGEHLAFVTTDRGAAGANAEPYIRGEPYNIGYTVSPPMNEGTLERVVANVERCSTRLGIPLLLENSPLYFQLPTSTMTQVEFIRKLCERTTAGLLLDLTHFYISSRTVGFDPLEEIDSLPLERVVEIHISGIDFQAGGAWDDHATPAPSVIYQLLARVCRRVPVRAVTLEYNWSRRFPETLLLEEIARTREVLHGGARH